VLSEVMVVWLTEEYNCTGYSRWLQMTSAKELFHTDVSGLLVILITGQISPLAPLFRPAMTG
jgi:hypothetical protein